MTHISKYRVVVVEDEPKIRRNIIQKIEASDSDFIVAGNAANGVDALAMVKSLKPDVLFTDIRMPQMDGLELIRLLKLEFPEMHIVILSGFSDFEYAKQAMKMGVRDYLLKPLKLDALLESLEGIKASLEQRAQFVVRNMIASDNIGQASGKEISTFHDHEHFIVFLICIGHLGTHLTAAKQTEQFSLLWAKLPLAEMFASIIHEHEKWWLIDEKLPNQKFLVLSAKQRTPEEIQLMAEQIRRMLIPYAEPYYINLCSTFSNIAKTDIWEEAQTLRIRLDQELVMGQSAVFHGKLFVKKPSQPLLFDTSMQNKWMASIQTGNKTYLKEQLLGLFNKWESLHYPQRQLEKALSQLLQIAHQQTLTLSEAELYHYEYNVFAKLTVSPHFHSIIEDIWHIIEGMLFKDEKLTDSTPELINQIAEYIRNNFAESIHLEEISQKFHFHPTYLTKVFKKHIGETPLKYLIKLRIDEAIRLITTQPQLDIRTIGEIVGYPDQHYFSRIFKNLTGQSPSEYKETSY
ncbi:response regulator [Paenibacillus psychroresistens]|uniref:Response regulator n=1 Tax=Paenibacillus psychroresistens TaxID=1778678 RepID=A0A6B8RVF4_9BACL|nr:response regulator [Paenibacillus psychroresistens]QGQ99413.1 response regulator [Paenibacillus psychroresistens]